jgi:hypothetical protein
MERELSEAELSNVTAGMNLDISTYPTMQADELTEEQLLSIYGGIPQAALDDKVMENEAAYREKALMDFIDEQIKAEELSGGDESASLGGKAM